MHWQKYFQHLKNKSTNAGAFRTRAARMQSHIHIHYTTESDILKCNVCLNEIKQANSTCRQCTPWLFCNHSNCRMVIKAYGTTYMIKYKDPTPPLFPDLRGRSSNRSKAYYSIIEWCICFFFFFMIYVVSSWSWLTSWRFQIHYFPFISILAFFKCRFLSQNMSSCKRWILVFKVSYPPDYYPWYCY